MYGNWKTAYNRHRRWAADGTWVKVLDGLRVGADEGTGPEWTVGVDSAVVRAHQHAAGARHAPPKDVDPEVLAPAKLDTGGSIELQEIRAEEARCA